MSERTGLKRRTQPYWAVSKLLHDIVEYAEITGDPEEFGTDAYRFLDKPHRFIRDLIAERNDLREQLGIAADMCERPDGVCLNKHAAWAVGKAAKLD